MDGTWKETCVDQDGESKTETVSWSLPFWGSAEEKWEVSGEPCLPPPQLKGFRSVGGDAELTWDFIRAGAPSKSDWLCHQKTGPGYNKMAPKMRRAVRRLYLALDRQQAIYGFVRGYPTAADIVVRFPPYSRPDRVKYWKAARAAGLRGPTAAHPNRVVGQAAWARPECTRCSNAAAAPGTPARSR